MANETTNRERGRQQSKIGVVTSTKMQKTIVVKVTRLVQHPLYTRVVRLSKKFYAHDEGGEARMGDTVRLVETRPISKDKRWRVVEILQHREVAEVKPSTIGREIEEETMRGRESVEASPPTAPAATAATAEPEPVAVVSEPEIDEQPEDEA